MQPRALALGVVALTAPASLLPSHAPALLLPVQSCTLALCLCVPVATAWYQPPPALVVLVARLLGLVPLDVALILGAFLGLALAGVLCRRDALLESREHLGDFVVGDT